MTTEELAFKLCKLTESERIKISEYVDSIISERKGRNKVLGYVTPNHPVTVGDILDSVEDSKKSNIYSWADVKKEIHEKYGL